MEGSDGKRDLVHVERMKLYHPRPPHLTLPPCEPSPQGRVQRPASQLPAVAEESADVPQERHELEEETEIEPFSLLPDPSYDSTRQVQPLSLRRSTRERRSPDRFTC